MPPPCFVQVHTLARRKSTPFENRLACIAALADRTPNQGIAWFVPAAEREALQITTHMLLGTVQELEAAGENPENPANAELTRQLEALIRQLEQLLTRLAATEPLPLSSALVDVVVFALSRCVVDWSAAVCTDPSYWLRTLDDELAMEEQSFRATAEQEQKALASAPPAPEHKRRPELVHMPLLRSVLAVLVALLERPAFQPATEALLRLVGAVVRVCMLAEQQPVLERCRQLDQLLIQVRTRILERLQARAEFRNATLKQLETLFQSVPGLLGCLSLISLREAAWGVPLKLLLHRSIDDLSKASGGRKHATIGAAYATWIIDTLKHLGERPALILDPGSSANESLRLGSRVATTTQTLMSVASLIQCFRLGAECLSQASSPEVSDSAPVTRERVPGAARKRSRSAAAAASQGIASTLPRNLDSVAGESQRPRNGVAYLTTFLHHLASLPSLPDELWRCLWSSVLTDAWQFRLFTRLDSDDASVSSLLRSMVPLAAQRRLLPRLLTRITIEPLLDPQVVSFCFFDRAATDPAVDAFRVAFVTDLGGHRDGSRLFQLLIKHCIETGQAVRWSPRLQLRMEQDLAKHWSVAQRWSLFMQLLQMLQPALEQSVRAPAASSSPEAAGCDTKRTERASLAKWSLLPLLVTSIESIASQFSAAAEALESTLGDIRDPLITDACRACWRWGRESAPQLLPELARVSLALLQLQQTMQPGLSTDSMQLLTELRSWQPDTATRSVLELWLRQLQIPAMRSHHRVTSLGALWLPQRDCRLPIRQERTMLWAHAALQLVRISEERALLDAVLEMALDEPRINEWICEDVDIWELRIRPSEEQVLETPDTGLDTPHLRIRHDDSDYTTTAGCVLAFLARQHADTLRSIPCLRLVTAIPQLPRDTPKVAALVELLLCRLLSAFAQAPCSADLHPLSTWSIVHLSDLWMEANASTVAVTIPSAATSPTTTEALRTAAEAALFQCLQCVWPAEASPSKTDGSAPQTLWLRQRFLLEPFLDTLLRLLPASRVLALLERCAWTPDTWTRTPRLLLALCRMGLAYGPRFALRWTGSAALAEHLSTLWKQQLAGEDAQVPYWTHQHMGLYQELCSAFLRSLWTHPPDAWRLIYLHCCDTLLNTTNFAAGHELEPQQQQQQQHQLLLPLLSSLQPLTPLDEIPRALRPRCWALWRRLLTERWEIPTEMPSQSLANALVTVLATCSPVWLDSQPFAGLLWIQHWLEQLARRLPRRALRFIWDCFEDTWRALSAPESQPATTQRSLGPGRTALLLSMLVLASSAEAPSAPGIPASVLDVAGEASAASAGSTQRSAAGYIEIRLGIWLTSMDAATLEAVLERLLEYRLPELQPDGSIQYDTPALWYLLRLVERLWRPLQRPERYGTAVTAAAARPRPEHLARGARFHGLGTHWRRQHQALLRVVKALLIASARALTQTGTQRRCRLVETLVRLLIALVDRSADPAGALFHPVLALALRVTEQYPGEASIATLWYAMVQQHPRLVRRVAPFLVPLLVRAWINLRQQQQQQQQQQQHQQSSRFSVGVRERATDHRPWIDTALRNLHAILLELWSMVEERARWHVYALTPSPVLPYLHQWERDYIRQEKYRGLG